MSIYTVTTKNENSAGALSPAFLGRWRSTYPMVAWRGYFQSNDIRVTYFHFV